MSPTKKKAARAAPAAAARFAVQARPAPSVAPLSLPALVAVLIVVWIAAFVRIWGALDEFWMDEIWSLFAFADLARSPWDIFHFHHDNNHYLVTLWMYVLGVNQANWTMYRLPSIVASVGTVVLAGVFARRWGTVAILTATMLTGSSYMLICLGSEARGYAQAGFFALVALLALDRFYAARTWGSCAVFVAATILGTLSHLTFVEVYLALVAWSVVVLGTRSANWNEAVAQLVRLHAVPLCAMGLLYLIDVRTMKIGGGDPRATGDVIAATLALVGGITSANFVARLAIGTLVVAALGTALWWLKRAGSALWVFFLVGMFIAPALLLIVHRPEVIYERYFALSFLLALLLLSYLASRLWALRPVGPAIVATSLVAVVAMNGYETAKFLRVGRGHFRDALEYVIEYDPEQKEIHLASEGKLSRPELYTNFYARYAAGYRFVFDDVEPNMPRVPDWLLVISARQNHHAQSRVSPFPARGSYELKRVFPYYGLSGMTIVVYRWVEAPPKPPAS